MSANSLEEQFQICRKTLDGLNQAGSSISDLASRYDNLVRQMGGAGYITELWNELNGMNYEFQEAVERLKRQLYEQNMLYVHAQGAQLKDAMSQF